MKIERSTISKHVSMLAMGLIAVSFSLAALAQTGPAQTSATKTGKLAKPAPPARPTPPARIPAVPPKGTLSPAEIPAPIKEAVSKAAPVYTLTDGTKRPDEDRYFLRLANGVHRAIARVTVTTEGVKGTIDETLTNNDVPTTLVEAFKKIVTNGSVRNSRKTIAVGGATAGAVTYNWESPTSASIAAAATPNSPRTARPIYVMAAADGSVMEITERIDTSLMPKAVADATSKTFPLAEIHRLNKITTNGQISYSFEMRAATSRSTVQATLDGVLKYETQTYTAPQRFFSPGAGPMPPPVKTGVIMTPTGF